MNALGISYTANSEDANDKGFSFMTVAGILVGTLILLAAGLGFTTDDLNTLRKNEAVQSVAAIQFSLYEQNENGLLDEISLEFQLKPGETFQVVGLNDEYWDYFMGDQLPEEQLGQLKSGNACIVRNPIPISYGKDVLYLLQQSPQTTFTKEQIYEKIWHEPTNNHLHAVENTIFQIRKRLKPYCKGHEYIKTVIGYGYKFNSG